MVRRTYVASPTVSLVTNTHGAVNDFGPHPLTPAVGVHGDVSASQNVGRVTVIRFMQYWNNSYCLLLRV